MDYVPDWTERSWRSAPYQYSAPDAPEHEEEDEWEVYVDDWEDDINEL